MIYYVLNNVIETRGTGPTQYRLHGNGNIAPPSQMNTTGLGVQTIISQQGLGISDSWGRQGESVAMEPMPPESSTPEDAAHEVLANNLIRDVLNTESLDDLVSQLSDLTL